MQTSKLTVLRWHNPHCALRSLEQTLLCCSRGSGPSLCPSSVPNTPTASHLRQLLLSSSSWRLPWRHWIFLGNRLGKDVVPPLTVHIQWVSSRMFLEHNPQLLRGAEPLPLHKVNDRFFSLLRLITTCPQILASEPALGGTQTETFVSILNKPNEEPSYPISSQIVGYNKW